MRIWFELPFFKAAFRPDVLEYLMNKGVDPEIHNADGAVPKMCFLFNHCGDHRRTCFCVSNICFFCFF